MATSQTRMGRKKLKKKKRKRIFPKVMSIFLLVFIAAISYSVYEYKAGFEYAGGNDPLPDPPHTDTGDEPNSTSTSSDNTEETFKGKKDELGKINVLLLGVDSHKTTNARTDTIMIAQYDPKNGTAKLASIMRDSYVEIPGYSNNKINSAFYHGGAELLRSTIKENFGIDVQYYALVNFDGFTDVVDSLAPNGIEIDVEKRMRYTDKAGGLYINLHPGVQSLNGEELLEYARFRHDSESDFGRVRRQQQVINAVKDELMSLNGMMKIPRMLGTIQPYVKTNMDHADMLAFGKDFLLNPVEDIQTLRIPIEGSYRLTRYDHAGSVIAMNKEENREALQEFFNPAEADTEEKTVNAVKKEENKNS